MAETVAKDPCQRTIGPDFLILFPKIGIPCFPSTYKVVFNASIGIKNILKPAAVAEAKIVLMGVGISTCSRRASAPVFAAVSPNLEIGPCKSAGPTPL